MPSALPDGDPVPATGPLPPGVSARAPFGLYIHVPFCATRCGYCDFNTYTATELGDATGAQAWADAARAEIRHAAARLAEAGPVPPLDTVFVGGGTPTLLEPALLRAVLSEAVTSIGVQPEAEVTVEANPETITPALLEALLDMGVTRLSLGMQSAAPHVLRALDRVHSPGAAVAAARAARHAGFDQVSLDLIYGGPGESDEDWVESVHTALSADPTHVSAYALVVEEGTALARKVAAGQVAAPDDDVLADRYERADELFTAAGLPWYEVSNWGSPCRHNLGYWHSADWWGVGPGAHSHVAGVRWWNVRHPARYAAALADGGTPAVGRELLDASTRAEERVLLEVRMVEGLPLDAVAVGRRGALPGLVADGLVEPGPLRATLAAEVGREGAESVSEAARIVLTRRGRLLADTVIRALVDPAP